MDKTNEHSIIPEGLVRCVWMDAGLVSYKLCDRHLQCDGCPFDAIFRQHREAECARPEEVNLAGQPVQSWRESLRDQLDLFLAPFAHARLPCDRMYGANHTWFRKDEEGIFTVGLDELAARVLTSVSCLVLPEPPVRAHLLSPCVWIIHGEGSLAIRSPMIGVITKTNERLKEDATLLARDPYNAGWLFTMRPEPAYQTSLLNADQAHDVFSTQRGMLSQEILKLLPSQPHIGTTMHDGGQRLESLRDILGSRSYFSVIARIFAL